MNNPLIPIAGAAALFLFLGGGKKRKEEEEEEIIEEEDIEEEPLGGGADYGDETLGGDGDGDGDGLGGGGGPLPGISITPATATGGPFGRDSGGPTPRPATGIRGGIPKGGMPTRDPFGRDSGGPAPRPTTGTRGGAPTTGPAGSFPRPTISTASIDPSKLPGPIKAEVVPAAAGEGESSQEEIDESVERQEDIAAQDKKDKNLTLCQGALFALGVGKPPKGKWGYYNSKTRDHLKTFQKAHGLQETGVCDIETKRKLDSEIRRRSSPKFCFGQEECNEFAEKALYSRTTLYVPIKTDPNTGETLEGAYYRVGPNAKIYYEAYESSIGISPVLTGAWPFQQLPWQSRYAIEKKIDRTGGDTWEVGKTIENEIFAGRIPGPGEKFSDAFK